MPYVKPVQRVAAAAPQVSSPAPLKFDINAMPTQSAFQHKQGFDIDIPFVKPQEKAPHVAAAVPLKPNMNALPALSTFQHKQGFDIEIPYVKP